MAQGRVWFPASTSMPTYRAVGFLRHCCPWGQVRYNTSATDYAARSIATQTRCFGKLQATARFLAVVLFLGYGSPRQARLSDEATRHAPPSAARPDSSRPRTAGAIQPPECARLATCRRAFSFDKHVTQGMLSRPSSRAGIRRSCGPLVDASGLLFSSRTLTVRTAPYAGLFRFVRM